MSSPNWQKLRGLDGPEVGEGDCAICLEPLGPDDGRQVLPCGHSFHIKCAAQWLQTRPRCPMCRHSPFLPPQDPHPLAPVLKVP